jgi:hypothetical protein
MERYPADELKRNRAAVLLSQGSEAERRTFALEAARALSPEPFIEAKDAGTFGRSLAHARGVLFTPDVTRLPNELQREVVRTLREREERPKLIFGLPGTVEAALEKGLLRDDLAWWLTTGTVTLKHRKG